MNQGRIRDIGSETPIKRHLVKRKSYWSFLSFLSEVKTEMKVIKTILFNATQSRLIWAE